MPKMTVNGIQLHYHVKGKGTPILFIHPPILTSENFNYQQAQLSDEFRIITFDIRGHGFSDESPIPLTYALIVEDMVRLLDALDTPECFVCGYSTGASIAIEAMLTYPNRFIGGIILSGMSEMSDPYNRFRLRLAAGISSLGAKRLLSGAISYGNADMGLTLRNLYRGAVQGHIRNIHQYYAYSLQYKGTAKLGRIKQPVLLLYGEKDKSFHPYAKLFSRNLPNATLHFLEGVSHQLPTKAPNRVNRYIRLWLRNQAAQIAAGSKQPAADAPFLEAAMAAQETDHPLNHP